MNFVSSPSIGPSHPVLKLQLLMFTGLKRLETRVIENCVFFNQEGEDTVQYILSAKWLSGCSEVGDHEIYQKWVQVTPFYGISLWKIWVIII